MGWAVEDDDGAEAIDVPEGHREAAEEVRAHLVAVRGGAPFLSPADARLLLGWLDAGVAVTDIVRAIERAAEARRANRSRLPLTLTRAKVHLGRPHRPSKPVPRVPGAHPYAGVASALRHRGEADLAARILGLDGDPDALVRGAVALARAFLLGRWDGLGPDGRAARLGEARRELEALDLGLDENALDAAAEEIARDALRREWPMLEAAQLWDAVHGGGP